jgi:hypothetical protein
MPACCQERHFTAIAGAGDSERMGKKIVPADSRPPKSSATRCRARPAQAPVGIFYTAAAHIFLGVAKALILLGFRNMA